MSKDLVFWIMKPVGKQYKPGETYDTIEFNEVPEFDPTASPKDKPYFIRLKRRDYYPSFDDIKKYAAEKYGFDPNTSISMTCGYYDEVTRIYTPDGEFTISKDEKATLVKPHIHEGTFANVIREYCPDYYGNLAGEFFKNGYVRITEDSIRTAVTLLSTVQSYDTVEDLEYMLSGGTPSSDEMLITYMTIVNRIAKKLNAVAFGNYF
jgi:hypothetical protein